MNRIVEGVLSIVHGLKEKDRAELLGAMMDDQTIAEDLYDILTVRKRRTEQAQPYDQFADQLREEGLLK